MKNCLQCGVEIKGRADKKFCDDSCRNSYNNKVTQNITNLMRNVNRTLSKNRRVLAELNPNGKMRVSREKLLAKGFSFGYFTGIYETKEGRRYYYVYDQGYFFIDESEQQLALVVKKDYVDG
jgi:predicted nucleic acid-binding Zn ribbon protein